MKPNGKFQAGRIPPRSGINRQEEARRVSDEIRLHERFTDVRHACSLWLRCSNAPHLRSLFFPASR